MSITLHIPMEPKPAMRPRFNRNGGFAYDDPRNAAWKRDFANHARLQCTEPIIGSVGLKIEIFSRRNPLSRRSGDIDNILKNIMDAMNGIVYVDDQYVVDVHIQRFLNDTDFIRITAFSVAQDEILPF